MIDLYYDETTPAYLRPASARKAGYEVFSVRLRPEVCLKDRMLVVIDECIHEHLAGHKLVMHCDTYVWAFDPAASRPEWPADLGALLRGLAFKVER